MTDDAPGSVPNELPTPNLDGRGSKWLRAPKPRATMSRSDLTEAEKIHLITWIDKREKTWGYVFAGMTVVLSVVVYLIGLRVLKDPANVKYTGSCPFDYKKVLLAPSATDPKLYKCFLNAMSKSGLITQMILQLGVAAAIWFTAKRGRRSQLLVAVFLGGLSFGTASTTFALLYLAFGAFLLIRSSRLQRETGGRVAQAARLREEREAKRAGRPTRDAKGNPTDLKPTPKPSKRYTPKAPTKRGQTPS